VTTDEERVDRGGWVAMTSRRYWGLENCGSIAKMRAKAYDLFLHSPQQ